MPSEPPIKAARLGCLCLLPTCPQCGDVDFGALKRGTIESEPGHTSDEDMESTGDIELHRPVGCALQRSQLCACYMPDCATCAGVDLVPTGPGGILALGPPGGPGGIIAPGPSEGPGGIAALGPSLVPNALLCWGKHRVLNRQ